MKITEPVFTKITLACQDLIQNYAKFHENLPNGSSLVLGHGRTDE
jgi:hypothetical protein